MCVRQAGSGKYQIESICGKYSPGDSNARTITSPHRDRQIGNSPVNLADAVSPIAPFHIGRTHYITAHSEMSTAYVNICQTSPTLECPLFQLVQDEIPGLLQYDIVNLVHQVASP